MSNTEILSAYRRLYRTGLQAVHYSAPARYQLRDICRTAFRTEAPRSLIPRRIDNTVEFLKRAKEYTGIEHRVLRNILHAAYWRAAISKGERPPPWIRGNDDTARELRRTQYSHLDTTVTLLNESMDLCLRTIPETTQALDKPHRQRKVRKVAR